MAAEDIPRDAVPEHESTPAELVAGGSQWNALTAAALVGGALAATAGAYVGTRALARRNGAREGKQVNSVMAAAITACDVNTKQSPEQPKIKAR